MKLDLFESTGGGFFNLQSYNVDDSLSLDNSAASINTLEVPEFFSDELYYDLRDSFDFRVIAASTATVTSNNAAATVNPSSTVTIPSDPKLLPVPGSSITFDVEYYLPRSDRVFVNTDGTYNVIRGGGIDVFAQRSQDTKSAILTAPNPGALELARINIGQYPSIPTVKGAATIQFLNKRIGTGGTLFSSLRADKLRVGIDSSASVKAQPRRYSMSDIGKLATRLENVEKTAALTRLELAIRDKSIPSDVDPTLERFKYGYFVEPFDNYGLGDTTNKEFRVSVEPTSSRAKPLTKVLNFKLLFDRSDTTTSSSIVNNKTLMLPYTEETLLNQNLKTSIVNPDGQRVQFIGEGTVEPYSFDIAARVDIIYTKKPPPVVYAYIDYGSSGGYDSSTTSSSGGWDFSSNDPDAVAAEGLASGFSGDPANSGGSGSSSKIICTKLYELGYMPEEIFAADQLFGQWLQENDPYAYWGYIKWASVVVEWMEKDGPQCMFWIRDKNKRNEAQKQMAIDWARRIAMPWAYHMAYRMGTVEEDNKAGRLIMKTGLFVSRLIGKLTKTTTPTKSPVIGYLMWGTFGVFWLLAGLKGK